MTLKDLIWKALYQDKQTLINNLEADKVKLDKDLFQCSKTLIETAQKLDQATNQIRLFSVEIIRLNQVLSTAIFEDTAEIPDWLDAGDIIYKPEIRISTPSGDRVVKVDILDVYTRTKVIRDIARGLELKNLYATNKKACAHKIWEFITRGITYEYDKVDDWRFSPITISYKKGDCEDTTILFVDLCREAGFQADEVFNSVGWFEQDDEKFGHSYPILNYGEGWFVYETTLNFTPKEPILFKGSGYTGDWGLSNWLFKGMIKGAVQI